MKLKTILALTALVALGVPEASMAQVEGDLRLGGVSGGRNGRLEVFHAGQWGTVCDDLFGDVSAGVACRQLGYDDGVEAGFFTYPVGVDPIWMDNVNCFGTESSLIDCPFNGFGAHNCVHLEDVGVHCKGCPASPSASCSTGFGKAALIVSEKVAGKEKMTLKMAKGPELLSDGLGNPLNFFEGEYAVCVYDDSNNLVGDMHVRGSSELCGTKPCWKTLGPSLTPTGLLFKDNAIGQDGIAKIILKAGLAGKSKVIVKGKNKASAGLTNLPSMAPGLTGSTSATVQVHTDEQGCFSANLDDVKQNDGAVFKATN